MPAFIFQMHMPPTYACAPADMMRTHTHTTYILQAHKIMLNKFFLSIQKQLCLITMVLRWIVLPWSFNLLTTGQMLGENATTRTVLRGSAVCCALHFVVDAVGPFRWCWYCTHRTQGAVPLQLHHTCEMSTCHFLLVSCLNTKSEGMLGATQRDKELTIKSALFILCLHGRSQVLWGCVSCHFQTTAKSHQCSGAILQVTVRLSRDQVL